MDRAMLGTNFRSFFLRRCLSSISWADGMVVVLYMDTNCLLLSEMCFNSSQEFPRCPYYSSTVLHQGLVGAGLTLGRHVADDEGLQPSGDSGGHLPCVNPI